MEAINFHLLLPPFVAPLWAACRDSKDTLCYQAEPLSSPQCCSEFAGNAAGDVLAVRALLPKPFELTLQYKFEPRQWYHVVVAHSVAGALSPSTVSLFVDGRSEVHAKFRYPKV